MKIGHHLLVDVVLRIGEAPLASRFQRGPQRTVPVVPGERTSRQLGLVDRNTRHRAQLTGGLSRATARTFQSTRIIDLRLPLRRVTHVRPLPHSHAHRKSSRTLTALSTGAFSNASFFVIGEYYRCLRRHPTHTGPAPPRSVTVKWFGKYSTAGTATDGVRLEHD